MPSEDPPMRGVLYREPCPPPGQLRMYAVDVTGARCFEITVSTGAATSQLVARWQEDARTIGGVPLALVRSTAPALVSTSRKRRRRAGGPDAA